MLFSAENSITPALVQKALGIALPGDQSMGGELKGLFDPENILPLKEVESAFREKYFRFVREHSQSDSDAAKKLGLAPPNYHRMMKELGLK